TMLRRFYLGIQISYHPSILTAPSLGRICRWLSHSTLRTSQLSDSAHRSRLRTPAAACSVSPVASMSFLRDHRGLAIHNAVVSSAQPPIEPPEAPGVPLACQKNIPYFLTYEDDSRLCSRPGHEARPRQRPR